MIHCNSVKDLSKETVHKVHINFSFIKGSQLLKASIMCTYCIYLTFTISFSSLIPTSSLNFVYPEIPLLFFLISFALHNKFMALCTVLSLICDFLVLALSIITESSVVAYHFSLFTKLIRLLLIFYCWMHIALTVSQTQQIQIFD